MSLETSLTVDRHLSGASRDSEGRQSRDERNKSHHLLFSYALGCCTRKALWLQVGGSSSDKQGMSDTINITRYTVGGKTRGKLRPTVLRPYRAIAVG